MIDRHELLPNELADGELRQHIDRSVSRALFDTEYARNLLADPTLLLEDRGCPPQQFLHLRSIRADNLTDFARQARALFWLDHASEYREDEHRVAAAAI